MNIKKLERYIRVNFLGPGPCLIKKNYPSTVSHRLRKTGLGCRAVPNVGLINPTFTRNSCLAADPPRYCRRFVSSSGAWDGLVVNALRY